MYLVFGRDLQPRARSLRTTRSRCSSASSCSRSLQTRRCSGMISIVHASRCSERSSFPRMIIPTAATLTAAMTLRINLVVVAGFVAWKQIVPQPDWLLIPPLAARALPLHPRRRADPVDAVRPLPRHAHRSGSSACSCSSTRLRSSTRSATSRPGRRRLRVPLPVHAGDPGHPRPRHLPGRRRPHGHRRRRARTPSGALLPIAIAIGIFVARVAHSSRRQEPWFAERA